MLGSQIAGRYRLDAELGRGGLGVVYSQYAHEEAIDSYRGAIDYLYDPDEARRLLAESGYSEKGAIPPLEYLIGESYSEFQRFEYLTTYWQKILGLEIELESLPRPAFYDRLRADPPAIHNGG